MVAIHILVGLDLCSGWLELFGLALYIRSTIVSFVDSFLLSLASNIWLLLLCKFLLCLDSSTAGFGGFSSLLVQGPQVSL